MKKKSLEKNLTVVDFFCGAGGFSEGFRQQGFKILAGIDHWEPAMKTFNHNFGLNCEVTDIMDFKKSIRKIEALPDTDIILGSPPCVSFSPSNISGKADKTSGITLTKVFLRIVAVKKWKKNSRLKAWFMENVPNSKEHLKDQYTFEDLGLGAWAIKNGIKRNKVAIQLGGNQVIVNSADYGSAQSRERIISGELIKKRSLIIPHSTHNENGGNARKLWKTLKQVKRKLPKIICKRSSRKIVDPNYATIKVCLNNLSDHFYDTGLFECEWEQSRFLKLNHPYMGRMSFPENESKPSRTITATKIGTSREAIIYKSEYSRNGNGEFRTPTIRESACIMGFPITYQFIGSEGAKCKLVGNAVCPSIGRAFAKQVRRALKLPAIKRPKVATTCNLTGVRNLNSYKTRRFGKPPKRKKGARFRRHPFKDGNITVTLSNYDIMSKSKKKKTDKWITSVQYGNGDGFPCRKYQDGYYRNIEPIIRTFEKGAEFIEAINNGFSEKIAGARLLQRMHEEHKNLNRYYTPIKLLEKINLLVNGISFVEPNMAQEKHSVFIKEIVPKKQLLALYAINKICTIANRSR